MRSFLSEPRLESAQSHFESSRGYIPRRSAAKLGDCNPNLAFGSKTFSIPRPLAAGSVDYLTEQYKDGWNFPSTVEIFHSINQVHLLPVTPPTLQKIGMQKQGVSPSLVQMAGLILKALLNKH